MIDKSPKKKNNGKSDEENSTRFVDDFVSVDETDVNE